MSMCAPCCSAAARSTPSSTYPALTATAREAPFRESA
jgi:hypothetical protein